MRVHNPRSWRLPGVSKQGNEAYLKEKTSATGADPGRGRQQSGLTGVENSPRELSTADNHTQRKQQSSGGLNALSQYESSGPQCYAKEERGKLISYCLKQL